MLRVFDIGSTLNAVMICRQIVYVVLSFSLMVYGGKSRTDYSVPSLGLFFRHDAVTGFPLTLTTLTLCLKKKQDTKLLPITSPNVNRFSKFFHWQTHW